MKIKRLFITTTADELRTPDLLRLPSSEAWQEAIMSGFLENAYSLVHQDNAADVPSVSDLRMQLEKGTDESKVDTMKRILTIMLNGDSMPTLLMHIIRFVMPSKYKPLKKLLYFYYEICPKLDSSGKLKQEMILVWYYSTRTPHRMIFTD